jgi:hypothetical protein
MEIRDDHINTAVAVALFLVSELMPFMSVKSNGILHALFAACARAQIKQPDKVL